ncbi:MAG: hypothetical protein JWM02_3354 [Frankiales bacterium]|nr:hypothetical protein [Frankiales bacterium]
MTPSRESFEEIDQLILCQLGEDWMHDFDGSYEAAEAWIMEIPDESRAALAREVDALFSCTVDAASRRKLFSTHYAFSDRDDSFDVWLRAVRRRATEALAGIHTDPLVDPSGGMPEG